MKSPKSFTLILALILILLNGCKSNKEGDIQDLKGILEKQKDKTTVQLKVEGSDAPELYFLRNDAMHPRLLYLKTGNDSLVKNLQKFWKVNNFSTSYYKDTGILWAKYKNSLDSAVLFSKFYLYNVLKIDPKKKLKYETTEDLAIQ
jgi:hypothetical protein